MVQFGTPLTPYEPTYANAHEIRLPGDEADVVMQRLVLWRQTSAKTTRMQPTGTGQMLGKRR